MRLGIVAILAGSLLVSGAAQSKPVSLQKAGLALEVTDSQKRVIVPPAGQVFLWIKATAASVQTIDLTKVALMTGASSVTLLGVDGQFDGDPNRFAMIGAAALKTGGPSAPLEQSWSAGSIAFAFTPGKTATLTISQPPQSFCLLFPVSKAFQTGKIKGLGPAELSVPSVPNR